ncbi:hypothetical protein [Phycicoccus avicenniae]|uniref:hypothetical protein n=1 Tax=Phycicoccus avicenniae TaxID=2828860 RepID=UPI003D2DBE1A
MSTQREVPDPWRARLIERGFVDGRGGGRPSVSALARKTGLHATTISNAIHGTTRADANTMLLLQRELGDDVAKWLNVQELKSWDPPAEAALLTDRQRKAVAEIILAMTEQQEQADGTAITRARGSLAHIVPARRARPDFLIGGHRVELKTSSPDESLAESDPEIQAKLYAEAVQTLSENGREDLARTLLVYYRNVELLDAEANHLAAARTTNQRSRGQQLREDQDADAGV